MLLSYCILNYIFLNNDIITLLHVNVIFLSLSNNFYLFLSFKLSRKFFCHFKFSQEILKITIFLWQKLSKTSFIFCRKLIYFVATLSYAYFIRFSGLKHSFEATVISSVFFLVSSPHFSNLPTFFYDRNTALRWLRIILKSCRQENRGPRRIFRVRR